MLATRGAACAFKCTSRQIGERVPESIAQRSQTHLLALAPLGGQHACFAEPHDLMRRQSAGPQALLLPSSEIQRLQLRPRASA